MRPLVLCHHGLSADWTHAMAVSPELFERQLAWLVRHGYAPVGAEDVARGQGKLLHVTFDDGLTSVRLALPALERLDIPSTVFVCASLADDGRSLDVPALRGELETDGHELETMTWDALRELAERGVEIGSHTLTHARLTQSTRAEVESELKLSRERIEDELGRRCSFLAYPYGQSDAGVRAAAGSAGYAAAFGLPGDVTWEDRFNLPRVGLWRKDGVLRMVLKTGRIARAPAVARLRGWIS